LIDTGSSAHGIHALETFLRCPRLYHYWQSGKGRFENRDVVFGSLFHCMMAHLRAPLGRGAMSPYAALELESQKYPIYKLDSTLVPSVRACYTSVFPGLDEASEGEVTLEVEHELEIACGPYVHSARIDRIYLDTAKNVIFEDYKTTGKVLLASSVRDMVAMYSWSGQMIGQHVIGRRIFGSDFGGVMLTFVTRDGQWKRAMASRCSGPEARFEDFIVATHEAIDRGIFVPTPRGYFCAKECPAREECQWDME
jgi:hypothetical protein